MLDYIDGKLNRTDLYHAVGDLTRRIRQIRPHVVLTFGPDGGLTGHVDHAMAGVFATMAFEWAGRPDRYPEQLEQGLTPHRAQKLYYHTADFVLPDFQIIAPPTVTARIEIGAASASRKKLKPFNNTPLRRRYLSGSRKTWGSVAAEWRCITSR